MDVKRQLTTELASIVKVAVRENRAEHVDVLPSDILNSVCNVIEAIFIHGLKETRSSSSKFGRKTTKSGKPAYPEPNFWPFLEKFTHRNIRAQIGNLNQIKTEIGRSRVWIRIALNDRVLENYISAFLRDQQVIKHFYNQRAYFRDSEQCDLMLNYTRALGKLTFKAPLNSSILNEWTPTPLKLAGLLVEKRTPAHSVGSMMLDMEDVMESDENSDVAVAVSALEYDGLDDPSFSDFSDMRSESQFSVQSRPVAAYGDRKLFFSPEESNSGSDLMNENVGGRNRREAGNELGNIYEAMAAGDDERQKLDAVLCSIGTSMEHDEKNPFADSGVATSPSNEVVVVHRHQTGMEKNDSPSEELVQAEPTKIVAGETTDVGLVDKEKENKMDDSAVESLPSSLPSKSTLPPDTEPKPIFDEQRMIMEHLEMSFSPGNSLAAHGWSSPIHEFGLAASSPSTSSIRSADRPMSSSVGNSSTGGFAALFSAVMNTSNLPKSNSNGAISGTSPPDAPSMESGLEKTDGKEELDSEVPVTTKVVLLEDTKGLTAVDVSIVTSRDRTVSRSPTTSLDNFVLVEESQESLDQAAAQKTFRLSLLTKVAEDAGLDVQGFKCHTCQRTIGLPLFGTYRVCSYDGHYYCSECHLNDEKVIPARIVLNWDFKPRPVSRASKAFLDHIADQPLIDLQKANPSLCDFVKVMGETRILRLQLSYVAMYLLTCKESVADDLRKRVWPKEYLYSNIDLYSISDLVDVYNGQMQKHLKSVIQYAVKHVLQQCRLCAQKGFICELCNDQKIIYAFQLDLTHRCTKCHAVYHAKCMNNQKQVTCPKCVRRDLYTKQAERASFSLDNMLPLG